LLQRIFRDPNEDIAMRKPLVSHDPTLMPLKNRIVASFNADCVKLIDQNGLSILGYIFLTNKYFALRNLYFYLKDNAALGDVIARSLNAELKIVLTHRVVSPTSERQYLNDFITNLSSVKEYFPTFQLNVENAKLFGYRLAKVELNKLYEFPDDIIPFDVPDIFVPRGPSLPSYAPPPLPPPLTLFSSMPLLLFLLPLTLFSSMPILLSIMHLLLFMHLALRLLLLLLLPMLLLLLSSMLLLRIRCIMSLTLNVAVTLAEQEKNTNGPKNNYENMFQKKSSMINITFIHNPLNFMTSTMCVNNVLLSVKPAHSGMPALTNQSSNSCTAFQYFTYPPRASSRIACFA